MRFKLILALVLTGVLLQARQPVRAKHAMVVAQEPLAADVGLTVLKSGGNAVDAAVAIGFALAVTYPWAGNIGGGGFMLVRLADGRTTFLDFRERAPQKSARDMYVGPDGKVTRDSLVGWRAAGVPGSVRGFEYASRKFGRKPWSELIRPAIDLAAKGFPVSYSQAASLEAGAPLLSQFPDSKRIFLSGADTLVQPELAQTLGRIARSGADEFYQGETARKLASEMTEHGGLITLADLRDYKVVERTPLEGDYRGYHIVTAPPPSSGGIGLLQMMGVLEGSGYEKTGPGSAATIHLVAEAMRRFYADRSEFLGDPDFFHVPLSALTNHAYIDRLRASIDREHATPSDQLRPGALGVHEGSDTTHFNVVDAEGNAVAVTYTLNGGYGSGVTVPGLGFLLNNEMDDFSAKPGEPNMFGLVGGEANAIQPGKRPLSSMTPTVLLKDGKLFMVVGAPGGSRIITGVMQVILNVIDFNMNAQDAIDAPRIHHQWKPDELSLERGISPDTADLLEARRHKLRRNGGGVAQVEAIVNEGKWLAGGTDGRGFGKAEGY